MKATALVAFATLLEVIHAFYLPGVIPHDYQDGERGKRPSAPSAASTAPHTPNPCFYAYLCLTMHRLQCRSR